MNFKSIFIGFLHGIVLTLVVVLSLQAVHEDLIFDQIVSQITSEDMGAHERALKLVETAHSLMEPNFEVFGSGQPVSALERLGSSDIHLLSPKGHCASYAHVLARLLKRIDGKYIPFDSMYNVSFLNRNGQAATYEEVGSDWAYYSQQVPETYPRYFDYHKVSYTNWNKIPVLMPFIKQVLKLFIGEKVNEISIRPYLLNVYKTYLILLVACYFVCVGFFLLVVRKKRALFFQMLTFCPWTRA